MSFNIKMIGYTLTIIFFIVLDRFLKILAINGVFDLPVYLAGNFFQLYFVKNIYIAFSLPFYGTILLIIIGLIIVGLIVVFISYFYKKDWFISGCLLAIIIGAFSNFFDRIKYGFVIDYFDLKYFTIFNLADAMIVLGVAGVVYEMWKNKKRD